jgi:H/ACA ribonucleoprotein complex subunit 2
MAGEAETKPELSYKEKKKLVAKIANPLAGKKLTKKCLKVVSKRMFNNLTEFGASLTQYAVAKTKHALRRGVKEVTKALRKGEKGYAFLSC